MKPFSNRPKRGSGAKTDAQAADAIQLIDNLQLGGAQRLLATLAGQLPPDQGLRVVSLDNRDGPFRAILEAEGARITRLGKMPLWNPFSIPRITRALRRMAGPTVHIHLTYATILGAPAARLAGKRVVVSLHNSNTVSPGTLRARILTMLEDFCLRHFTDQVVFVGSNVERANRKRIGKRSGITIPNVIPRPAPLAPVDRDRIRGELGAGPNSIVVIAAGRLSRQKDPLLLIRAFAAAQAKVGNLTLWMVGDGPLRDEATRLAAEIAPASQVRFLGARNDVDRLLASADIFALSSQWEGLPVALLEAMAAGLAIVSTNVGDVPGVLTDNDAVLVQPADQEAFSQALVSLAQDGDLRRALAARALVASEPHCDVAAWRSVLERVYAGEV